MSTRRWAFVLAVTATSTALCVSVLAGWQRGGSLAERLVLVAIGLVLVTSAHLLPALLRGAPVPVRYTGRALWAACLVAVCFGHAQFFVLAQQHVGEQRASTVQPVQSPSSGRSLMVVMAERATTTARLAAANARYCAGNCATLEARRVTLAARLDALNAEADELRRAQLERDRATARRDALLADPVTSRLAALLGTTVARVDVLSALTFAAVLEGIACLLWTVALRPPLPARLPVATGGMPPTVAAVTEATDATQHAVAPVVTSHADKTVSPKDVSPGHDDATSRHAPRDDPVTPLPIVDPVDDDLTLLARDVSAGLLRPTVVGIRRHLGCSQARATTLRRHLAERDITA